MAEVEMVMPKMGESIMEATVLTWLKNEGDVIEADESVLEVATDKVDTEVPATHAGVLSKILAQEGDIVPVGQTIAVITTDAKDISSSNGAQNPPEVKEEKTEPVLAETEPAIVETASKPHSNGPANKWKVLFTVGTKYC